MKTAAALLTALLAATLAAPPVAAAPELLFTATLRGDIAVAGNAIGLAGDRQGPDVNGALGALMAPGGGAVPGYPNGTTADWREASSAAVLSLPPDARVVRAVLVWSASWADGTASVDAQIDDPVWLHTAGGSREVWPDGGARIDARSNAGGFPVRYYTRHADVTEVVARSGPGTYAVQGVPVAAAGGGELSAAGWTLIVAWYAPSEPTRSLAILVGADWVDEQTTLAVDHGGFCTPPVGAVTGRIAVAALEGDAHLTGDTLWLARPDGTATPMSSGARPLDNAFGGLTDPQAGATTFAARVHDLAGSTAVAGARQGWDLAVATLGPDGLNPGNGATQSTVVAETRDDSFVLVAAAWSIDTWAPDFARSPTPELDDGATLRLELRNTGVTPAHDVVVRVPDAASRYVAGSWRTGNRPGDVHGAPVEAAAIAFGVPVGDIGVGQTLQVEASFRQETTAPALRPEWSYAWSACPDAPRATGTFRAAEPTAPPADGSGDGAAEGSGGAGEGSGAAGPGGGSGDRDRSDDGSGGPGGGAEEPYADAGGGDAAGPTDAGGALHDVVGGGAYADVLESPSSDRRGARDDDGTGHPGAGCSAAHRTDPPLFAALLLVSIVLVLVWSRRLDRRQECDSDGGERTSCVPR